MASHIVTKILKNADDLFKASDSTDINTYWSKFKENALEDFSKSGGFESSKDYKNLGVSADYGDWVTSFEGDSDTHRKINILYYNLLEDLKNYTSLYINFKNKLDAFNGVSTSNSESDKLKQRKNIQKIVHLKDKEFKKREMDKKKNLRLAKYYDRDIEDYKNYTQVIKYIYYFFLFVIFGIFFAKSQFTNLKILFYILLLFLISYAINPLYDLVNELTYNLNRTIQLIINYVILFAVFVLFVSFKYFVFKDEEGTEGKRDMYILSGILGVGFVYIVINYFFFGVGIKSLLKV